MPSLQDLENSRKNLSELARQYWIHHSLFTWQWWLLLCLTIVPWMLWWKLVNKKRIVEIFSYGTLIVIISTVLDITGANLMYWAYPKQLLWFLIPPLLPIDLSLIPVEHILVYQYFQRWRNFVIALCIAAVFNAYVGEPLFTWGGMYELYSWKYTYSIPIYILKAVFARWLIERLMSRQIA